MCPNQDLIEKFFSFRESISFLENDLISTIVNLSSLKELVPTLFSAFRTAKPILEQKFNVVIDQTGDDEFPIKIPNFDFDPNPITQKMGSVFESLSFKKSNNEEIMKLEKQQLYNADYDYTIDTDGISVNAAKLFKLIFQTSYGDNTAMFILMDMLAPLFRDITGGHAIVKIASILAKGRKDKIFDHMGNLVRLIIIGMITDKIEMKAKYQNGVDISEEEIKQFSESFDFTDNLVNGIVFWIKGALMLLDKDSASISTDEYREVFYGMCDALSIYEEEIGREDKLVHDISKQTDLMITIVGLCKGIYSKIEVVGVQVGCFENVKVRELMNILNKYKETIFRDKVFGLPPFSIKGHITGAMSAARSGIQTGVQAAKDGMMAAGRAGMNQLKGAMEGMGGMGVQGVGYGNMAMGQLSGIGGFGSMPGMVAPGIGNLGGVPKLSSISGIGSLPKMPSLSSLDPDKLVFGDMFKQFDVDRSGYIDYNEFCELCKYMGLFLDKEKSLKLFSMADKSNNNQIEMNEFKYAMALLKLQIAFETLNKLGLTIEDLVWYGILAIMFLLLLFVFIFLGISAFSKAEGFNAVVNSLLPLTAGAAMAARKVDIKGAMEKVKGKN